MRDYNREAGMMLRTLCQQRGLTLGQASARLHTSTPVLSRKERGLDQIERLDIRLAIATYQLDPWESYALWLAAGFVPEPTLANSPGRDLHTFAGMLLIELSFPAFIVDVLGYLKAWNQFIEAIWAQHDWRTNAALPPVQASGSIVQSDSLYGPIDYLVLQTTFPFPQAYELVVYIPFGVENHLRYEQFKAQIGASKLYFSE